MQTTTDGAAGVGVTPSVMERLRDETRDLHTAAERHPFQSAFIKGQLARERYVAWLEQMRLVHGALEGAIDEKRGELPALELVKDVYRQVPHLDADLRFFGVDPSTIEATPATAALLERVADADALTLLGFFYVLEGANNGNTFIARAVRGVYRLTPGEGDRYLDPYGEQQRPLWAAFKAGMDDEPFSVPDADRLVDAARVMFQAVHDISDDLASEAG